MTLTVPLEVRLKTGRTDRVVTADLRDLTFRAVDPGGYASAAGSFARPLILRPDELDYYANLYVYDRRRGTTVWEGWIEDLGGSVDESGQIWHFAAVGPAGHVKDRSFPYVVVDSSLDKLAPDTANQDHVTWQTGAVDEATGAPAIIAQLPPGSWVLAGAVAEVMYRPIFDAGMEVARVSVGWDSGMASTLAWQLSVHTSTTPTAAGGNRASVFVDNVGGTMVAKLAGDGGTIGSTDGVVALQVSWDGPTNYVNPASGDQLWWTWDSLAIRAKLYDKTGSKRTSGYSANTVTADEVVADLLGRGILDQYDGPGAVIATGAFGIGHLAYPDATTAEKVLADLILLEPGMTWHAWESNTAGKYRFEWTAYSSTVGYEADVTDGYSPENTASDLINAVRVRYKTAAGEPRTVRRTQNVPALTNAGRTREGFVDVGDEAGVTAAQANQVGDTWLAAHAVPSNAGRLRIAQPILNVAAGRMVDPWELTSSVGKLIRVAGVQPRIDTLNPAGRDGVAVFRIVSVEVSAADGSATLELDVYSLATAAAVASFQALAAARRRRR